jgi:hypothetical protein
VSDIEFDPYYRWLGIAAEEQPANHYRLLGLRLFEGEPDVISEAADRQMGHLRTHQLGEHAALSQRLLNEVAAARICLLDGPAKAAYDAALSCGSPPAGPEFELPPGLRLPKPLALLPDDCPPLPMVRSIPAIAVAPIDCLKPPLPAAPVYPQPPHWSALSAPGTAVPVERMAPLGTPHSESLMLAAYSMPARRPRRGSPGLLAFLIFVGAICIPCGLLAVWRIQSGGDRPAPGDQQLVRKLPKHEPMAAVKQLPALAEVRLPAAAASSLNFVPGPAENETAAETRTASGGVGGESSAANGGGLLDEDRSRQMLREQGFTFQKSTLAAKGKRKLNAQEKARRKLIRLERKRLRTQLPETMR